MSRTIAKRIQVGMAVTVLGVGLATGTAAALDGCSNSDCGSVLPTNDQITPGANQGTTVTAPSAGPELALTEPASTSSPTLPFTGADVVELSLVGLGAVGAGTIMVRRSRSRRVEA